MKKLVVFSGRSWCYSYYRKKWTWGPELKSFARQSAIHIALTPLGNPPIFPTAMLKW